MFFFKIFLVNQSNPNAYKCHASICGSAPCQVAMVWEKEASCLGTGVRAMAAISVAICRSACRMVVLVFIKKIKVRLFSEIRKKL